MKMNVLWLTAFATFAFGGCLAESGSTGMPDECQAGRCDGDGDGLFVRHDPELVAVTADLLQTKCGDCHGKGQALGGLADILDAAELKRRGLVATGDSSDASALVLYATSRHQEGGISPITGRPVVVPTEREVAFVREWIDAGAPALRGNRQPLDLAAYVQRLRADAAKVPQGEAPGLAYVDLHAAYNNNRFSDEALSALANATLKALHQLDVRSTDLGAARASVVFDDDGRPLAVRFDAARLNLDKQRDVVGTLARLANRHDPSAPFDCAVPTIPALDFVHVAASDDVYNPLADGGQGAFESGYANVALRRLLVDAGLLAEEQRVFEPAPETTFIANGFTNVSAGVDLYDVLAALDPSALNRPTLDALYNAPQNDERLLRGCLVDSSTSAPQRCIDRLVQSEPRGGTTYLSFDALAVNDGAPDKDFFAAGFLGPGNPAADPLVRPVDGHQPFVVDGGQGIVRLKNAMLGFLSFNADFQLVSNAPTYAALERASLVRPPLSSSAACASCHHNFVAPFTDDMLPALLNRRPADLYDADFLPIQTAQRQNVWDEIFDIDSQYYVESLRRLGGDRGESSPFYDTVFTFGSQYRDDLSYLDVAAELGAQGREDEVREALSALAFPSPDAARPGFAISRDDLTRSYQALVVRFGSGNEDFLRGCVARSADVLFGRPTP